MRRQLAPPAWLAVLLTFAGCGDTTPALDAARTEAPEVAAALDWAEAADMDFGAAPFSPPGWPYRIGDEIDWKTLMQLDKRFGTFLDIRAVIGVDGRAFGATFNHDTPEYGIIYEGHFPKKTDRDAYEMDKRLGIDWPMPPGARLDLVLGDRFEQSAGAVLDSLDVLRARWHEPFRVRYGGDGKR
ncbi:MAG: hypothetical protein F4139_00755 [Gemmatimonadetes bacterium]|nr:hypothetical protein [Gemmatimonadota bacterium]MYH51458.1 hypothetical protein [Gemmatimonadota bacterium]